MLETITLKPKIIALDLDGTLLDSDKKISLRNINALELAARAGADIVPATGRFWNGVPAGIRALPFIRHAITINGASVLDLESGETIYSALIPWRECIEILTALDRFDLIYDCYLDSEGWMSREMKRDIDRIVDSSHYRKMLHTFRREVPDLKAFLAQRKQDVQKLQFFTRDRDMRLNMLENLGKCFQSICISSSMEQNVEINHANATKGHALEFLAGYLGHNMSETMSFGDSLNDLGMLRLSGVGIAMSNACPQAKRAADHITLSCDEDGVAHILESIFRN